MTTQTLNLTITGPDARPDRVPMSLLAAVLQHVEQAVKETAKKHGFALSEGEAGSLVDVRAGSEILEIALPEVAAPAVVHLAAGLSRAQHDPISVLEHVSRPAYAEMETLSKKLAERGWDLRFEGSGDLSVEPARFGATAPLAALPAPPTLRGTTTIYGKCLRVGGATKPRAEVRVLKDDTLLYLNLSIELAKELATRLYEEVVLEGQATWNVETWQIESFRVSAIADFRPGKLSEAFEDLAQAAKGRWDDVDALDYVKALRADDE